MPTPKMANSPAPHVASAATSAAEYAASHVWAITFAALALAILGATLLALMFWRRRCNDPNRPNSINDRDGGSGFQGGD